MTPGRTASPFEPTGRRRELARLVGQIQALTLELKHLWQDGLEAPEVDAKEHTRERLRRHRGRRAARGHRRARAPRVITAAISSPSMRTGGWLGSWLSVQHSLRVEAVAPRGGGRCAHPVRALR